MRGFAVPGTGNATSNGLGGGMQSSTGVRPFLIRYFISLAVPAHLRARHMFASCFLFRVSSLVWTVLR